MKRLQSWKSVAAAALLLMPELAPAAYPEKPVTVVLAFPAGGGLDVGVRQFLSFVTAKTGTQFIVDNRAGAGGLIGTAHAARGAPDGYTLLFGTSTTLAIAPVLRKDLQYDALRDFVPISHLFDTTPVLLASPSLPVNSLRELIDYAKKHPGKLSYASNGVSTTFHLTGEWLAQAAGIGMVHVPYKEVGQSFNDTATGRIQLVINGISATRPLVNEKKLKIIATAGAGRSPTYDNAPTMAETYPGLVVPFWEGALAPAKTSGDIIARLNRDFVGTLQDAQVRAKLEAIGREIAGSSPEEFARLMKSSLAVYQKIVAAAGMKME